jgi:hypothetical protein
LELLRSRENRPESRANTRSALLGSNDNCGFLAQLPADAYGHRLRLSRNLARAQPAAAQAGASAQIPRP